MSDWGAAHDTREAALNGLDLENGLDPQLGRNASYDDCHLAQPYLDLLKTKANCRWPGWTTRSGAICA